jgi:hypothetical protein
LSDIQAMRLECNNCCTTISFKPEEWKFNVLNCPNCLQPLIAKSPSGQQQTAEFLAVDSLISALKTFRAPNLFKFKLRLELDRLQT